MIGKRSTQPSPIRILSSHTPADPVHQSGGFQRMHQRLEDTARRLGTLPLMYQPGERWLYGVGSNVLSVLIARVSGQPLETFLRERLLEPLGMKDTGFCALTDKLDRLASGGHSLQLTFRLIRFYDIPLDEVEVSDQEQFRRIKRGRMLERDIDLLHQAAHHFMFNAVLDYGFLERDKPDIWNEVLSTTDYALMFPYWMMEEELLPEIVDFAERPDLAVLLCTKR